MEKESGYITESVCYEESIEEAWNRLSKVNKDKAVEKAKELLDMKYKWIGTVGENEE